VPISRVVMVVDMSIDSLRKCQGFILWEEDAGGWEASGRLHSDACFGGW
jgi:hypothetical protein